jgi:hypothetical protein
LKRHARQPQITVLVGGIAKSVDETGAQRLQFLFFRSVGIAVNMRMEMIRMIMIVARTVMMMAMLVVMVVGMIRPVMMLSDISARGVPVVHHAMDLLAANSDMPFL